MEEPAQGARVWGNEQASQHHFLDVNSQFLLDTFPEATKNPDDIVRAEELLHQYIGSAPSNGSYRTTQPVEPLFHGEPVEPQDTAQPIDPQLMVPQPISRPDPMWAGGDPVAGENSLFNTQGMR
ncbi:hypothetical protein K469DRAFT_689245 [Zopfia rhizophila CBS 207.26]|uniref:Uncharacterized protein n=1 Tax=Zopfia rhizophila CBS 207.26 TaxID=1314779 RepID=A0A6A6ET87_9PEZI|nr:hypothetical protein K469DRAFT_689245 [Zopfia rhizophila CBS 207.26]